MQSLKLTKKEVKELLAAIVRSSTRPSVELSYKIRALDSKTPCKLDPRDINQWYQQTAGDLRVTKKEIGVLIECLKNQPTSYLLLQRLKNVV